MKSMHFQSSQRKTIDLSGGLVMRWSTKADTNNVVALVGDCFRWFPVGDPLPEDSIPGPNEYFKAAVRRMLSGKNATMSEFDYALVEDKKRADGKNPIVACVSLHRHLCYYGSVDVHFGKPELVATDPEYRNKGLIRKLLLEMIHPESEARGDVLQFILGIQHFYRQFGYDYGLYFVPTAKIESLESIQPLAKDESEQFTLRQATVDDIPFLKRLSTPENRHTNAQVGAHYSPEYWQYTVHDIYQDKQHRFDADRDTRIIVEAASGRDIGFVVVSHGFMGHQLEAMALEQDASYVNVSNSAVRQIFVLSQERHTAAAKAYEASKKKMQTDADTEVTAKAAAIAMGTEGSANGAAADDPKPVPFVLSIALHECHPVSVLLGNKAKRGPKSVPGYRLYTRIPDYVAFITTVTPELERRLNKSALAGVSGRLRLDFFRQVEGSSSKGLELVLEKGKIVEVKNWVKASPEKQLEETLAWKKEGTIPTIYFAAFAPLTFMPLLTGKNSLEELLWAYGENLVKDEGSRLLLDTLFPKGDHHFDIFYW